MKKGLILTAVAAILGIGISPLHAEADSGSLQPMQKQMIAQCEDTFENAPTSPQDDDNVIAISIIEVGTEHWKENVQDICEFIGTTQQAEWNEYETEGHLTYNKEEYSSDGKTKYQIIVIPYSDRYAAVMIRVIGKEKSHGDFVVPNSSFETMAGMCIFSVRPDSDHERWDNDFWDTCNVLGIDVLESEWTEHETEYGPSYSKMGFDEKGENMYKIYMVPPIDEDDLCAVTIIRWAL